MADDIINLIHAIQSGCSYASSLYPLIDFLGDFALLLCRAACSAYGTRTGKDTDSYIDSLSDLDTSLYTYFNQVSYLHDYFYTDPYQYPDNNANWLVDGNCHRYGYEYCHLYAIAYVQSHAYEYALPTSDAYGNAYPDPDKHRAPTNAYIHRATKFHAFFHINAEFNPCGFNQHACTYDCPSPDSNSHRRAANHTNPATAWYELKIILHTSE